MRRQRLSMSFARKAAWWLSLLGASAALPAFGQASNPSGADHKERPVMTKPQKTIIDPNASQADVIVLKFRKGTGIRLGAAEWIAPAGARSPDDLRLLQRANLDEAQVSRGLELANALAQTNPTLTVARLFTRPEGELDLEKQIGEENSNEELADLNLYFHLF